MATYQFSNLNETPPGMYRYFVPETKTWFRNFLAIQDLASAVRQHYKANQLPCPDNLAELIADQLCPDLPPERCTRVDGGPVTIGPLGRGMSFTDVVQGTKTLISWWWNGSNKVEIAEANRRAEICSRCQYNQQPTGCAKCNNPLMWLIKQFVGPGTTSFDSHLKACRVCKCSLRVKVWFPMEILLPHMPDDQKAALPDFCWLKHKP